MRDITKRFRGVAALTQVNLNLYRGEIHAVVGENGAGKSTLMKILSGSHPCHTFEGRILLAGEEKEFSSPKQAREAGIEMIYQETSLHPDLTIGENIFVGSLPIRGKALVDWEALFRAAENVLQRLDFRESPRKTIRDLGSSQQQMVAIAKALARNPVILILDEPTAAVTQHEASRLLSVLNGLRAQGISCIYVSHRIREVFELADRVTVLRDGRVVSSREIESTSPQEVIREMLGRELDQFYPALRPPQKDEILRVENLSVPHPYSSGRNILQDISFSVSKGEIVGLAGLIGSGRSELVNAIFGAGPHDGKAKMYLNGQRVEIRSPKCAIKLGIGLLPEDRKKSGFIETLNVQQNITLASLRRISNRALIDHRREHQIVRDLVHRLRIKLHNLADNVMDLSGGNQQKVVLAKWLMADLKLLILDEPTRGIDVGTKAEIYMLIVEMAARGLGIIIISSELSELVGLCHRVIVVAKGSVQAEFTHQEASEERILRVAASTA